jgi:hypothetical protein
MDRISEVRRRCNLQKISYRKSDINCAFMKPKKLQDTRNNGSSNSTNVIYYVCTCVETKEGA